MCRDRNGTWKAPAKSKASASMKFIVSSTALLKQLQVLQGVLASSNTLPILDNFLFEIDGKELTVTASDLETTITATMPVEGKEKGSVAIPARILLDTLKAFPEQPLTFSVDGKHHGVEISSDQGKYKMTGYSGTEFPQEPGDGEPQPVRPARRHLATAINKTIFATGNDDLRPVMSGIFFELGADDVRFVATDAHKLVRYSRTDVHADQGRQLHRAQEAVEPVEERAREHQRRGDRHATTRTTPRFTFDNTVLVCRLIDGKYPNYEAVIPKKNPNKLTIDRETFLNTVRRVAIFANKTTHQVRLHINGSQLAVSAEDLDFANEANEKLTCSYEGEEMTIGFNSPLPHWTC